MADYIATAFASGSTESIQLAAAAAAATLAGVTSYVASNRKKRKGIDSQNSIIEKKAKKTKDTTIVDVLKSRRNDNSLCYSFLNDRGDVETQMTLAELDTAARSVAYALQSLNVQKGDRVILCYPPGLDFAAGFWGCLYAGAIAIPTYPPYPGTLAKDLPKFTKLVENSGAKVALTNRTYHLASKMATFTGFFSKKKTDDDDDENKGNNNNDAKSSNNGWPSNLTWLTPVTSKSNASLYQEVPVSLQDMAFFQYSSGSTSEPKAIMISHRNIRAQLKTWESIKPTDTLLSWLPSYHDMGLVGFTVVPIWTKSKCISMSPISFIKDPAMWMKLASSENASHVCAPNFAYALAARKTSEKVARTLNLSNLRQAICAAEPIRVESLEAFTEKFAISGFSPTAFNCGYGLAETTLVCTGQDPENRTSPVVLRVKKDVLESEKVAMDADDKDDECNVMTFVGCGAAAKTMDVKIASFSSDNTGKTVKENHVGEICVTGDSVAEGYYGKPKVTKSVFNAIVDNEKSYLRTGDLGFFRNGQLFVTGRIKDLIIIRGRNVCPQDVEFTVESAHELIRPGCSASFSIDIKGSEVLVVVAECRGSSYKEDTLTEISNSISQSVLREHQLPCYGIVLLNPRGIPKTTSGKIQRHMSRSYFLSGKFKKSAQSIVISTSAARKVKKNVPSRKTKASNTQTKTASEIEAWLLQQLRSQIEEGTNLDPSTPWASLGMDSIALVSLSSDLSDFLGNDIVVPPSAFFDYQSPKELASAPGLATGELKCNNNNNNPAMDNSASESSKTIEEIPSSSYEIENFPELTHLNSQITQLHDAGLEIPYLQVLTDAKRKLVNYNTYNYLGTAGHPEVSAASVEAIKQYGTSMSSSPIVGQTQVNEDLEAELCSFFRAEAAVLFVGGWVSNVTTIDALVGSQDLILCDALNHNSCVTGQRLSGATVLPFPHNDVNAAERILSRVRTKYRRVLIVIEGCYSMDGDIPDLKAFVSLKKKYKSLLFLDEAHSFGTMGETGRGLCEHADVSPKDVDIRMGTMSKALGSTGGFILGSAALIQYLKLSAGGFVFSVGLTPCNAASALAALKLIQNEPQRVSRLQKLSTDFRLRAIERGLEIGSGVAGAPVVVVVVGSTVDTAKASMALSTAGFDVKPIVYPAVEEGKCRLRFFHSSLRTTEENNACIDKLAEILHALIQCSSERSSILI